MRKSVQNCQSIDQVVVIVMEDSTQINDCMVLIHLFAIVDLAIVVTQTHKELYSLIIHEDLEHIVLITHMGFFRHSLKCWIQ